MALIYVTEKQNDGAVVSTSVSPSVNDYDGKDGNDISITWRYAGTYGQNTIGTLNVFLKPHITYDSSEGKNRYEAYAVVRMYATNLTTRAGSFNIRLSGVSPISIYDGERTLSSVPGSSIGVGRSSTITMSPGTNSGIINLGSYSVTVSWTYAYGSASTYESGSGSITLSIPSLVVNCSKNFFTCTFDSNGAGWVRRTAKYYYGQTPDKQAFPNPPSDSLNRNVTVTFTPTNGNESAIPSTAQVLDSWNNPGSWNLRPIYSDTAFNYTYTRNYNTTPVMIPAWSTMDGKPTRNGYLFNYWNYNGNNIGSEPNTSTSYAFGAGGTTTYSADARWTETSSEYSIYAKYKDGDEIKDIPFKDDSGNTNTKITFTLSWESSKNVSSISFKSFLNSGLRVDSSKVYSLRDNSEVTTITGKMTEKEYYVLYNIIDDKVTLRLNGGLINGSSTDIVIPYTRFSEIISIKSDYKPTKPNTTFVAWFNSATNKYVSELDPTTQTTWPSNIVLDAEYIPIGLFYCRKDKAGKLYWEAIINKWVFHNGAWRGEYEIPGTDIVHTSTSMWLLKDGEWHLEYGKQSLPLSN